MTKWILTVKNGVCRKNGRSSTPFLTQAIKEEVLLRATRQETVENCDWPHSEGRWHRCMYVFTKQKKY